MKDYYDYRVWKEVYLYGESEYLQEGTTYQPEDISHILSTLLNKGKEVGLEGCFIEFNSTMESYEDFLGPVQVVVGGYRKLTEEEKEELAKNDAIVNLAEERGISFHEARVVFDLQERGKL